MTLSLTIKAAISGLLTGLPDIGTLAYNLNEEALIRLSDGVGAKKANKLFTDKRTLAGSASESLDLAGVLSDPIGQPLTFTRIKAMLVIADITNANDVVVGGGGANAFLGPFGDASDTIKVRPGGHALLACEDATGWPVTPGTGDLLKLANSAAGSAVNFTLLLVGEG